ncbi:Fis family transcriptional regulator [Pseudonocardia sp. DSM 110487]|uniref:sigma-54-dependent Fis family transcriptional regulator n=1 Tax=Pseudonocardia sp. DSM 110487 TaxID=2865833 RepID=UPI001C6A5703|nr:helix-turn-helix domain-containing protein [Pseudonocardia sp. DSM 110487]QYN39192.1 Fis family transcriptional regulator [Pseudonocardia sp. DSM 110487]
MGDLADRRLLLTSARAAFLERADTDLRGVPGHVAASWRRSVSSGVHPSVVITEYHSDLDFGSRLVRCALPVIEQLGEQIADIPTCVALTDDRARLLVRRDSSRWSGRVADRLYFAQGFGYAEGSVGTNGVGTVLEFGDSVHIVGAEHFVESLQPYACAGAPIRDPFTGRIEGVLDISCLSEDSSPILHSLVRSAAARIQRNLLADRNQQQQALFDTYTRVDARSRQAVLAVGPRTVMANSPMQTLLDPGDMLALQDHLRFLMIRHATVDERVDLPSGARVRLRGSTVTVGAADAGMVAVVSVLNEVDGGAGAPARAVRAAESGSPAWRVASAAVGRALRAGSAVLVIGEPGSGRFTLLSERYRHIHETGRVVGIEAEQVEAAPMDVAAAILRPEPSPALPVLRDVDRLSGAAMDALLAALGDDVPSIAATAAEPTHDALLTLFGTSATVPPLRNRSGDLPALVDALLAGLAAHRDVRLSREALRLLSRYDWPGNVRQLRDALASALRRRPVGRIEAADLPAFCQSAPRSSLRPVDQAERDAIVNALRDAGGNRVAAAAALGLARSTLYRKIRQYRITV